MHFWPTSGTLSEVGAVDTQSGNGGGGGAGAGGGSGFGGGGGAMQAMNAGEIMLSRAETAALAALETEPDEKHGLRRAKAESGLTEQQIKALQRRAQHALSKGITLKGPGFTRKPVPGAPEEPSLVRRAVKGKDTEEAMAETLRTQKKAVEALRDQLSPSTPLYTAPVYDYRVPVAHSLGEADDIDSVHLLHHGMQLPRAAMSGEVDQARETNAQSTMAKLAMASRNSRRRRT